MAWLINFDNRIKFTIDHTKIDEDLTHFPVTLSLSSTFCSEVFSELWSNTNRFKIAFTKDDGITELYGEIEQFDCSNSKAVYHISKNDWTIVSGTNTDFYMYYDSSHADNTNYIGDIGSTAGGNVWDSNFKMVQHMCQDPSGSAPQMIDSTSNDNDGTSVGGMGSGGLVDGKIGKAIEFDGDNDLINCGQDNSLKPNNFTLSYYSKVNDPTESLNGGVGYGRLFSSTAYYGYKIDFSSNVIHSRITDGVDHYSLDDQVLDNNEHIWEISYDGSYLRGYKDGEEFDNLECAITINYPAYDFSIGGRESQSYSINGIIDEVRVSNIARSAAWIKATYDSLFGNLVTKVESGVNAIFFGFNF